MRILVTGGRSFKDAALVRDVLGYYNLRAGRDEEMTLIQGGANGLDALAQQVAAVLGWRIETFVADWELMGRAAGPMRNQKMIDIGKPDLVLAFEGGRGTADMTEKAIKAGLRVTEVRRAGHQMVLVHRHPLPDGAQL